MAYHLHFVGKQYYTLQSFVREAELYGVSRRISLTDLCRMNWGDKVLLAILDGKSGVVFGQFTVTTLTGLSPEASRAVREEFGARKVDDGGGVVKRGCGKYITGASYEVETPLPVIARFLMELKRQGIDIGKPMIGGPFEEHPPVRLKDVPFRQGFRLFDYSRFLEAVKQAGNGKKVPVVKGQFYVAELSAKAKKQDGKVQEVQIYWRKEELEPRIRQVKLSEVMR
ncbi:hypothetical protein [Ammonifex thiophilus]|uniref:Uncharacterized protein n=1 Tax=Ammonifex thiophilus TaxID=444093 RepID=A0A3D8P5X6_9THEO|nr:hypothetical protein [Ammonifex thiophilus]RDV83926.1 hypothetical protein DXX99_03570 [Ammonifex thiophilus]